MLTAIRLWAPVLVWAALIYVLSGIPSLNTGWGIWDLMLRKAAHVVEFGVLCLLIVRALYNSGLGLGYNTAILCAAAVSFLYAVSDELHQAFVPGRGASTLDVVVDAIGIALAALLSARVLSRRRSMLPDVDGAR